MRIGIILFLIVWILGGVGLVGWLQKKGIYINRWFFGFGAFLVVLIPSILFPTLPAAISNMLYLLSGLLAIMFFETGRRMLEKGEIKGIVRSEQFADKK